MQYCTENEWNIYKAEKLLRGAHKVLKKGFGLAEGGGHGGAGERQWRGRS